MKILYKISDINLRDGIVTVDYWPENHPDIEYKIGFEIPMKEEQFLLGDELETEIMKHAPARMFQRRVAAMNAANLDAVVALMNTEGSLIIDTKIHIGIRHAMKHLTS